MRARCSLLALTCLIGAPAQAATFCVNSQASFQAALDAAGSNGAVYNYVLVVAGNYALTTGLVYSSSTTSELRLMGSMQPGCMAISQQFGGAQLRTVLDGQHLHRPLLIDATNAEVQIWNLDFAAGLSTNNRGGGLSIYAVNAYVWLNQFYGNRADDFAGGLFVQATGQLHVFNNLFFANSAATDGAAEFYGMGAEATVVNNTAVGNSTDAATAAGGFRLAGLAHFSVSNNILWNNHANGGVDLIASNASGHIRLHNDIGTSSGSAQSASSTGNVSVEPGFAPCNGFLCFSFELRRSSPLVDVGTNAPPGYQSEADLLWGPRFVGSAIDMGAYEVNIFFSNGFE